MPFDHLPIPDREGQRLSSIVTRVEFGAVTRESAAVVDIDFVAFLGFAGAFFSDKVLGRDFVSKDWGGEESEEERGGEGEETHCCR